MKNQFFSTSGPEVRRFKQNKLNISTEQLWFFLSLLDCLSPFFCQFLGLNSISSRYTYFKILYIRLKNII